MSKIFSKLFSKKALLCICVSLMILIPAAFLLAINRTEQANTTSQIDVFGDVTLQQTTDLAAQAINGDQSGQCTETDATNVIYMINASQNNVHGEENLNTRETVEGEANLTATHTSHFSQIDATDFTDIGLNVHSQSYAYNFEDILESTMDYHLSVQNKADVNLINNGMGEANTVQNDVTDCAASLLLSQYAVHTHFGDVALVIEDITLAI